MQMLAYSTITQNSFLFPEKDPQCIACAISLLHQLAVWCFFQVNELVEAAAGLISVIDDLRPLDPTTFNAGYEIWKAIAAVPAADR